MAHLVAEVERHQRGSSRAQHPPDLRKGQGALVRGQVDDGVEGDREREGPALCRQRGEVALAEFDIRVDAPGDVEHSGREIYADRLHAPGGEPAGHVPRAAAEVRTGRLGSGALGEHGEDRPVERFVGELVPQPRDVVLRDDVVAPLEGATGAVGGHGAMLPQERRVRRGDPSWCNEGMSPERLTGARRAPSPAQPSRRTLERVWRASRVDLCPGAAPSATRLVTATLASLVLSVVLDALAVHVATSSFPSTRHFSHFRGADYGALTVAGVLLAAGGWSVLVRLSSAARWLYFRLVVAATLVLWIPDAVLLALGEPAAGVVTLTVMHLLVAVVTYNLLVRLAPAGRSGPAADAEHVASAPNLPEGLVQRVWGSLALVVVLELVLGVAVIVSVPYRRPAAVLPTRGIWLYAAHGAVGIALGVGALAVLVLSRAAGRIGRVGAVVGIVGVALGAAGGVFATFQQTRLLGMGMMLVGTVVAGVGYLAPALEAMGKAEAAKAEAARAAFAGGAAMSASAGSAAGPVPGVGGGGGVSGADGEPISTNGHGAAPPRA